MAFVIGNGSLFTGKDYLERAYIEVENGEIRSFGKMEEFQGKVDVDVKGALIMPAWVNAHTHIYSTLARGMSVEFNPLTFTQILQQLWWRLDRKLEKAEVEVSALAAAADFIHHGVATIFDHHSSPSFVKGSLEVLKRAVVDTAKMRGVFCYEVSDRDGIQDEGIEENVDFHEKHVKETMCAGMMGLHAAFTLSDETLKKVSEACEGKIPIHIHVAEGPEDEVGSINKYGLRIIERLNKFGLLVDGSIYAHCIHVSEDEIDEISKSNGTIAVNPQSNMNNAVGIPNVVKFLSRNTRVVLGNDGFGFAPAFDLRFLELGQKHERGSTLAFGSKDLEKIFTNTYALASERLNCEVGKIENGAAADLMVIDYDPPTPITSDNFYDHLFFGITEAPVVSMYIAGRNVLKDGKITVFDEKEVKKEARKIAIKLWERL